MPRSAAKSLTRYVPPNDPDHPANSSDWPADRGRELRRGVVVETAESMERRVADSTLAFDEAAWTRVVELEDALRSAQGELEAAARAIHLALAPPPRWASPSGFTDPSGFARRDGPD